MGKDNNFPASVGEAVIPYEEAHEPKNERVPKHKNSVTFAPNTQSTDISNSQKSSTFKEALSQPARGLSHRDRLRWLQQRRGPGLWVQCDDCNRWRHLPHVLDAHELPKLWYCKYNPDTSLADCSKPEAPLKVRDEEDLIHSEYSAGSLVWARMAGWPWWPAMVDDCPDTEQYYWLDGFSDIPTQYNVVFFDAFEATRAWIAPEKLKPYDVNKPSLKGKDRKYKKRLEVAITQANDAQKLTVANRIAKYSFLTRYPGSINRPKKATKHDFERYQRSFKRKYNIDIPDESFSLSDDDLEEPIRKLSTAKKAKTARKVTKSTRKRKAQNKRQNKKRSHETSNDSSDESDLESEDDVSSLKRNNTKKLRETKVVQKKTKKETEKVVAQKVGNIKPNNKNENLKVATEPKVQIKNKTPKAAKKPKDGNTSKDDIKLHGKPETDASDEDLALAETPFSQINETASEAVEDVEFVKPSNSLAVHVGSTGTALMESVEQSFDNDTSKTYVPPGEENKTEIEPSMSDIVKRILNRSSSACSGDFDF